MSRPDYGAAEFIAGAYPRFAANEVAVYRVGGTKIEHIETGLWGEAPGDGVQGLLEALADLIAQIDGEMEWPGSR